MKIFLFKLFATALVTAALLHPFINPESRSGVFASLNAIGWLPVAVLTAIFLVGVALYCWSLQRCLSLVRPACRTAQPKSVWLMFLLPYNFVEDFFIVNNITRSLWLEAQRNSQLNPMSGFGAISGYGWCTAQIASLLPSLAGEVASVVALACWAIHWRFIGRVNKLLISGKARSATK